MIKEKVEQLIKEKINIKYLEINDTSSQHTNHANYKGGSHLRMKIVSDDFIEKVDVQGEKYVKLSKKVGASSNLKQPIFLLFCWMSKSS